MACSAAIEAEHELVEVMLEVLAVGYLASGKLALLLAVPPGYASPIFPPAGISVAAMLIGGPATLPWTFLGSFLLNLWTAYSDGHGSDEPWWIAAVVIASASMLQAAIGGTTLRHAVEEAEVGPKLTKAACLSWSLNLTRLPPPS